MSYFVNTTALPSAKERSVNRQATRTSFMGRHISDDSSTDFILHLVFHLVQIPNTPSIRGQYLFGLLDSYSYMSLNCENELENN